MRPTKYPFNRTFAVLNPDNYQKDLSFQILVETENITTTQNIYFKNFREGKNVSRNNRAESELFDNRNLVLLDTTLLYNYRESQPGVFDVLEN